MMRDLQRSVEGVDLQPTDSWNTVKGILGHLKPLILVADVEDFSGIIAVPHQLRRLQEEFRQFEEQTIRDNLHYFGVHLVDKTSIMAVVGDSRIELVRASSPCCVTLSDWLDTITGTAHDAIAIRPHATPVQARQEAFRPATHPP